MARPTNRQEFADFCIRRLGGGVAKVHITDDQLDDRIDEALNYYREYHFSGSENHYFVHQVTEEDKVNKYVTLPEGVFGVTRMFPVTTMFGTNILGGVGQFALSDLISTMLQDGLVPYWLMMTHVELIQQVLVGQQPIRFNQHTDRVYLDMNWNHVQVGSYIVLEGYKALDPDVYPDVWNDLWLQKYATQLIKRQWGENIKRWGHVPGPGGMTLNGQMIYDEADAEIAKLEREMITSFSMPVFDLLG